MERIEIELDTIEYSFKMGAETMVLREPSLNEQFSFEATLSKMKPDNVEKIITHYQDFIKSLGGKEDMIKKLNLRHITQLLDALKGKKK